MSARAAWRLESLGFSQVYRYTPGKMDWLARGLPREGAAAAVIQADDLVRQDGVHLSVDRADWGGSGAGPGRRLGHLCRGER